MKVRCPHCASRYELPERLLGPAGAQVRCPGCRGLFAVARDGTVSGVARAPGASRGGGTARPAENPPVLRPAEVEPDPGTAPDRGAASPEAVARALVDELAAHAGEAPREAFARGKLFSEWGPALAALHEEYRHRAGERASAAPLRAALLERWGIELAGPGVEDPTAGRTS